MISHDRTITRAAHSVQAHPGDRSCRQPVRDAAFALHSQGHSVICVPDAGAGLHHLTRQETEIPDLVILALQTGSWPQHDQLNLLAFGRLYHRVAIILLTMPDHRLQLPPYLAARHIARLDKPFRVQQLLHLVATLPVANVPERSGRHG